MINNILFRQMFYQHKDIMLLTGTADGRILNANNAAQKFYGYTEEELQKIYIRDFEFTKNNYTVHRLSNGEEHEVDVYSIRLTNETKETILVIIHDISLNILIEQKLHIIEERLHYALENAGDGVWDWDMENNGVFFSPRWKEMFGYSDNEITPSLDEWWKRIHPDEKDKTIKVIQRHLDGKSDNYRSEYRFLCKDGKYKWILDRGKVVSYKGKKPIRMIGTHTDLSEMKEIEQKLHEANRKKDTLLSIISHDLYGPIGSFKNLIDFIVKNFERYTNKEILEIVYEMQKTSASITDLLVNLLNWARLNRVQDKIVLSKLAVKDVIKVAVENLNYLSKDKNIKINVNINEDLHIYADYDTAVIIVRNIISNAIKFSYPEGSIDIYPENINNQLSINIADQGTGIAPAALEKINANELRISSFGTNHEKGSGLGLGLCKEMISLYNGNIKIESELGKGTIVKIFFPVPA